MLLPVTVIKDLHHVHVNTLHSNYGNQNTGFQPKVKKNTKTILLEKCGMSIHVSHCGHYRHTDTGRGQPIACLHHLVISTTVALETASLNWPVDGTSPEELAWWRSLSLSEPLELRHSD